MTVVNRIRLSLLGILPIWVFFVLAVEFDLPPNFVFVVSLIGISCVIWMHLSIRCPACGQRIFQIWDPRYALRAIPRKWPFIPAVCPYCRVPLDQETFEETGNGPAGPIQSKKDAHYESDEP